MVLVAQPTVTDGGSEDDVAVVRDRRRDFGTHVVRNLILGVPADDRFPDGIKYAFHDGRVGADQPILRYDNHHGVHERHEGDDVERIDFPGYERLLERFQRELPDEHSPDTPRDR